MNRTEGLYKTIKKSSTPQRLIFHDCQYHPLIKLGDLFQIDDGFITRADLDLKYSRYIVGIKTNLEIQDGSSIL